MFTKCLGGVGLQMRNIELYFGTDPDLDQGSVFHQEALMEV